MTVDDLVLVIERTGHERFRELIAESHPDHVAYRESVRRLADGFREPTAPKPAVPLTPLAESLRARRSGGLNCLYSDPPTCGCGGSAYCWRLGRDCTLHDCLVCLGPAPKVESAVVELSFGSDG